MSNKKFNPASVEYRRKSPFYPGVIPDVIKVNITQGESGVYIANLPEFDIFTEADHLEELGDLVNDLIYVFFDIQPEFRHSIRYLRVSPIKQKEKKLGFVHIFHKFISSEADRAFRWNPLVPKS